MAFAHRCNPIIALVAVLLANSAAAQDRRSAWPELVEGGKVYVCPLRAEVGPVPIITSRDKRAARFGQIGPGISNPASVFGESAAAETTSRPYLMIDLALINVSPDRKADYTSWQHSTTPLTMAATLVDEHGNKYRSITTGEAGDFAEKVNCHVETIGPQRILKDRLVFEEPVSAAKVLTLTLPAANVSGQGSVQYAISRVNLGQVYDLKMPTGYSYGPPVPEDRLEQVEETLSSRLVLSHNPPNGFTVARSRWASANKKRVCEDLWLSVFADRAVRTDEMYIKLADERGRDLATYSALGLKIVKPAKRPPASQPHP